MKRSILAGSGVLLLVACGERPRPSGPDVGGSAPEPKLAPTQREQPIAAGAEVTLHRVAFADLPGWREDGHAEAIPVLAKSCRVFSARAPELEHGAAPFGLRAGDWASACEALEGLGVITGASARAFFEEHFAPVAVGDSSGETVGRFTGYYDPLLRGSRRKHGAYRVPVYARPPDLVSVDLGEFFAEGRGRVIWGRVTGRRLEPYHTRTEIETGALAGRKLELLWIDDPVSVFFAQVQGSARVELENGRVMRLAYAGKNGRKYLAIGRKLVEDGELERGKAGLPEIRAWLEAHPEKATEVMRVNDGFVFFDLVDGLDNRGAMAVPLTAERSMAIDRTLVPLGAPMWLDTKLPDQSAYRRLMVGQDTGGAIRGAVRGDIYFGAGARAEELAGHMVSEGRYYVLLPRRVAERLPTALEREIRDPVAAAVREGR